MPGFPTAPAVQTVTDKLATIAPELGNVPGYYVYLKDPIAGTIYESATVTDSGGNWSIAGVTMGLTYQYSYGVHPNTAYPFRGAYVASNPSSSLAASVSTPAAGAAVSGPLYTTLPVYDVEAAYSGSIVTDTQAWNAAVVAANAQGGGRVRGKPGKTYNVLNVQHLSHVYIDLRHGVILNKSGGAAATHVIEAKGTITATTSLLTANAAKWAQTVTVANGALFNIGDYVLLFDLTYKYTTVGRNQEILRVLSVAGNVVSLTTPTYGAYTTANTATLTKILPVLDANIEGGTLINPNATPPSGGLLYRQYCAGYETYGLTCVGPSDNAGFRTDQSQWVWDLDPKVFDGTNQAAGGYGYGFQYNESSLYCGTDNGYSENCRENAVTNNSREIDLRNSRANGMFDNDWNTHGSGCENVRFQDCHSFNSRGSGFTVGFSTPTPPAFDQDVTFDGCTSDNSGAHGWSISTVVGQEHQRITLRNCKVNGYSLSGVGSHGIHADHVTGLIIAGKCEIDGLGSANPAHGVYLDTIVDGDVDGAYIRRLPNAYAYSWNGCTNLRIQGGTNKATLSNLHDINSVASSQVYVFGNQSDVVRVDLPVPGNLIQWDNAFGTTPTILPIPHGSTHAAGGSDPAAGFTDPLQLGFASTMVPGAQGQSTSAGAINRATYSRSLGPVTGATSIGISVLSASGNIDMGLYTNSGTGRTAVPGTKKVSVGSTVCPAIGFATVAIAATNMAYGDWFGFAADNATATFGGVSSAAGTAIMNGLSWLQSTAFPLPSPAVINTSTGGYATAMRQIAF